MGSRGGQRQEGSLPGFSVSKVCALSTGRIYDTANILETALIREGRKGSLTPANKNDSLAQRREESLREEMRTRVCVSP